MLRTTLAVASSALLLTVAGCKGSDEEAAMPALLRTRFETEMKTILHDLKLAEEQANALQGTYLELGPLKSQYFNHPVPDTYDLQLQGVSADGFRAVITHRASGLSCRLEVGVGAARGVPICYST